MILLIHINNTHSLSRIAKKSFSFSFSCFIFNSLENLEEDKVMTIIFMASSIFSESIL